MLAFPPLNLSNKLPLLFCSEITGTPQALDPEQERKEEEELHSSPLAESPSGPLSIGKRAAPLIDESSMTSVQRKRFAYFKQMRIFITNLTNICERLRFKERDVRRYFLQRDMKDLKVPPFVYVPMLSSADDFCTILRALPKECHAFTTKARVPALMLFELEAHPQELDVATFLGLEMEKYPEQDIVMSKIALVHNYRSSIVEEAEEEEIDLHRSMEIQTTKFADHSHRHYDYWVAEGTGLNRLRDDGLPVDAALGGPISKTVSHDQDDRRTAGSSASSASSPTVPTLSSKVEHNPPQTPEPQPGPFGETFHQKIARLRGQSPYGHLPGWRIGGLIAKSNDDVRQEVFVMQLIAYYQKAFIEANVPVYLHSYRIMSTSKSTGLIELITDASSIDGIKKRQGFPGSMRGWYEQMFGFDPAATVQQEQFKNAMENYVASMAGYSIVTYLLAIKDRYGAILPSFSCTCPSP